MRAHRLVAASGSGLLVLGLLYLRLLVVGGLLVDVGGSEFFEPGLLGVGEQLEQFGLLVALELGDLLPEGVDLHPVVGADLVDRLGLLVGQPELLPVGRQRPLGLGRRRVFLVLAQRQAADQ